MIISSPPAPVAAPARPGPMPARRLTQFGVICLALSWIPWAILGLTEADIGAGPAS